MSADLFADFNQPAAQPTQAQSKSPQPPLYQSSPNPAFEAKDPFDFGYSGRSSSQFSPPPQQWSSFSPQPASLSAFSMPPAQAAPVQKTQNVVEDDDGWGDFEVAETSVPQTTSIALQSNHIQQAASAQTIAWPGTVSPAPAQMSPNVPAAPSRNFIGNSFTTTQDTLKEIDSAWSQPKPQRKQAVQSQAADSGVLFDAADFELEDGEFQGESDDEFGDFETVETAAPRPKKTTPPSTVSAQAPPAAPQPSIPSMDLLSLDDSMPVQPSQSQQSWQATSGSGGALRFGASLPGKSKPQRSAMDDLNFDAQFETKKPVPVVKAEPVSRPKPKSTTASTASTATKTSTAWDTNTGDDEWAAWDEAPSAKAVDASEAPSSWDWETTDSPSTNAKVSTADATTSDSSPPPVNVPPPSVLLSVFPDILNTGSALFKSTSGQGSSVKEQILSNPKAVQFLQGYILLATTAARIMAGRKHRWHRDKILAKSMSISASGSKGMKLAGVDKTQAQREDREAADVVAVWREQVGRLRSAVTVANGSAKTSLKVPELSETLSAHTTKLLATAPKPCVICGLKRDERISKVDFEVEDSFGEWWVEHWGHRACKNFWIEHEKSLRQR